MHKEGYSITRVPRAVFKVCISNNQDKVWEIYENKEDRRQTDMWEVLGNPRVSTEGWHWWKRIELYQLHKYLTI